MSLKIKAGDWVWHEFSLFLVESVYDPTFSPVQRATVRDGVVSMGNVPVDELFPLGTDTRGKAISDNYREAWRKLDKAAPAGFNHPGFHRYMVERWVEAMRDPADRRFDPWTFVDNVIKSLQGQSVKIDGISILRP